MSWELLIANLEEEMTREETEVFSTLAGIEDLDAEYANYKQLCRINKLALEFVNKIKNMDVKLDKILERIG